MLRTCSKCNVEKNHSQFPKRKDRPYGIDYRCKVCDSKKHGEYYQRITQTEYGVITERNRNKRSYQNNKKWFLERRNRIKDSFKEKARIALRSAVSRGLILKPKSCQECGDSMRRIDGHHPDYSRPLDVEWLCAKCHKHRHMTPIERGGR